MEQNCFIGKYIYIYIVYFYRYSKLFNSNLSRLFRLIIIIFLSDKTVIVNKLEFFFIIFIEINSVEKTNERRCHYFYIILYMVCYTLCSQCGLVPPRIRPVPVPRAAPPGPRWPRAACCARVTVLTPSGVFVASSLSYQRKLHCMFPFSDIVINTDVNRLLYRSSYGRSNLE